MSNVIDRPETLRQARRWDAVKAEYVKQGFSHREAARMASERQLGREAMKPKTSWISHACLYPAAEQAEILPSMRDRRHPFTPRSNFDKRPEWSGYCVIADCACSCHQP